MKTWLIASVAATVIATAVPVAADDFEIAFEWGDTPSCSSGNPWRIPNPEFVLSNVPQGTVSIAFRMRDLDAPSYRHGGGKVDYEGQDIIAAGAFQYKGPCPPRGSHQYRWTAEAIDASGDVLAEAKATREFPE